MRRRAWHQEKQAAAAAVAGAVAAAAAAGAAGAAGTADTAETSPAGKKAVKKRARIWKGGSLEMIVFGNSEANLWAERVGAFLVAARQASGRASMRTRWRSALAQRADVLRDALLSRPLRQNRRGETLHPET